MAFRAREAPSVAGRRLLTAGASGIGKEIAKAFLGAGDTVYTCDINQAALGAAAHELNGLKTGICDVGDRQQIEIMVADAAKQLGGGIDVLVNNAASRCVLTADGAADAAAGLAVTANALAMLNDPGGVRDLTLSSGFFVADYLPALVNALRVFLGVAAVLLFWIVTE